VFDKEHDREVLAAGARGNVFQLHDDNPKEFDAWNVDLDYLDHRVDLTAVSSIAVVERDARRGAVRFVREFGSSVITQTMRLASGSRRWSSTPRSNGTSATSS
jgi:alpha-mannosidase